MWLSTLFMNALLCRDQTKSGIALLFSLTNEQELTSLTSEPMSSLDTANHSKVVIFGIVTEAAQEYFSRSFAAGFRRSRLFGVLEYSRLLKRIRASSFSFPPRQLWDCNLAEDIVGWHVAGQN